MGEPGSESADLVNLIEKEGHNMFKLWNDEEGLTTVEYALLLALLVVAALATWTTFGSTIRTKVTSAGTAINGIS